MSEHKWNVGDRALIPARVTDVTLSGYPFVEYDGSPAIPAPPDGTEALYVDLDERLAIIDALQTAAERDDRYLERDSAAYNRALAARIRSH